LLPEIFIKTKNYGYAEKIKSTEYIKLSEENLK